MRTRLLFALVSLFPLAPALSGCDRSESPPPQVGQNYSGQYQPPPGQTPPAQYPPAAGQPPPGQWQPPPAQGQPPPPAQGQPPPPPAQGQPPPPALPPPGLPNPFDPINTVDLSWLRTQAGSVLLDLIAALPAAAQAKVQGIPFMADPAVGEVNAYAACDDQGLPLMAITDGLLQIEAYISQFKATDELFGTRKLDGYLQLVAQNQRPNQPIVTPPAGFVDPVQNADSRKVARQHQLMEAQLSFVLGHELAHHHLGHTGCANGQGGSRGVNPADFGRLLARVLPAFNQPNEVGADIAGTNNLLAAGAKRQGYKWNEEGAFLTLDFFARLEQLTPVTILFGFSRTHPPPQLRRPIVQQAAASWRSSGGTGWQIPQLPNLFGR